MVTMRAEDVAPRHGVSAQCVRRWLAKGMISQASRGRIDVALSEQMLEAYEPRPCP